MTLAKRLFLPLLLVLGLAACAPSPRYYHAIPTPESAYQPATEVYFAPLQRQTPDQQDRDRYECYLWAKEQAGFDPSYPHLAPHQRTVIIAEPAPGNDMAVGAITGGVIGAVIGSPRHAGGGALIGALAGGALGAASDAKRQQEVTRFEAQNAQQTRERRADLDRQAGSYRRALQACLEGRGYSVH